MSRRPDERVTESLFKMHLATCVPLRIDELRRQALPLTEHVARVSAYAQDIGEYGDQLLFRGPRTKELINKVVDGLAVMAFIPGGVTLFGLHFEEESHSESIVS